MSEREYIMESQYQRLEAENARLAAENAALRERLERVEELADHVENNSWQFSTGYLIMGIRAILAGEER